MTKIDRVVVMCHKGDVHLTGPCIASIRRWNPTIPLFLHKDELKASFDTRDIESQFNVGIANSENSSMGNYLSPLFFILEESNHKSGERILVHDSDILWMGNVIERLEEVDCDLLVSGQVPAAMGPSEHLPEPLNRFGTYGSTTEQEISSIYFDPSLWNKITGLELPNMVFNCGQYVYKVGSLKMKDFSAVLTKDSEGNWSTKQGIRLGDQGATNFIASWKHEKGELKLKNKIFAVWPKNHIVHLNLDRPQISFLAHWAGLIHPCMDKVPNGHVWKHYYKVYFKALPNGRLRHIIWQFSQINKLLLQSLLNIRLRILGKHEFIR